MANLEKGSTAGGFTIITTENYAGLNVDFKKGRSAYSGANNGSKFVKIATSTISNQYDQSLCLFDVLSGSSGNGNYQFGTIYFRVKQQNAMGGVPVVTLTLSNPVGMTESDVVAVLSKNDATSTVVDLFLKVTLAFDTLHYQTRVLRYHELVTVYDSLNNGGFLSTAPTGVAQFSCVLSDGSFSNGTFKSSLKLNSKDVLTIDHTSATNPHTQYVRKTPYSTLNQNGSFNQYTLIGTATLTSQYQQAVSLVSLLGGAHGNASNTQRGLLYFRVKQQSSMGSAPNIELVLMDQTNFSPTDIVAVLTTNTSSQTVVQLYVKINNSYEQLWFNPVHEILPDGSTSVGITWSNQSALLATSASLPTGTQTTATLQNGVDGTTTMNASTTSVTVSHNLGYVPKYITCTAQGNVGNVWVPSANITATQFTINCATAPASNTTISYRVK